MHHPIGISHATKRPPYDNYKQARFGLRYVPKVREGTSHPEPHTVGVLASPTQNGQIPQEIDKKITSEEYETQRDTVRHVLELLDLQKPGTTDRSQDVN
ncbi:hypothetical protein HPB52_004776 [Rhipicephalus sanguineus]|uniref:Uncharacterized protein n=1 Tax=Rhipicephalus sanguineus TaxID=34632 RepID=A0A9D4PCN3_RHISA|nr:hypothetical protein HPB52_004776 [Rhipicephalus sanguineus]